MKGGKRTSRSYSLDSSLKSRSLAGEQQKKEGREGEEAARMGNEERHNFAQCSKKKSGHRRKKGRCRRRRNPTACQGSKRITELTVGYLKKKQLMVNRRKEILERRREKSRCELKETFGEL